MLFLAHDYRENFKSIIQDLGLPANPSLYIHAPARLDAAMSPQGEDTLIAIVPVGHMSRNGSCEQDWGQSRDEARQHVFRRLASLGINDLESHIKFETMFTPLSWRRRYNLMKGSTHGLCHPVRAACRKAKSNAPHAVKVIVEVESLAEVRQALAARADIILLDNMIPATVRQAVRLIKGRTLVEVSGGITLKNVQAMAAAGPDRISIGALTHSAPAATLSLDARTIEPASRTSQAAKTTEWPARTLRVRTCTTTTQHSRRMFKRFVRQGRSERLKMVLPSLLVYVVLGWPG